MLLIIVTLPRLYYTAYNNMNNYRATYPLRGLVK